MEYKITAPAVVSRYETELDSILAEEHHVVERKTCRHCHGSKVDLLEGGTCTWCRGHGWEYEVKYGVENESPYIIVNDNTVHEIIEYCYLRRMHEEPYRERMKAGIKEVYKLPLIIRLDLISKGHPIDEWEDTSEGVRKIAKVLQSEYGETFMLTNLKI